MKAYSNGMKATEFSRKQISVIYGKAKSGELKIEKWVMSELYDMADFYNYDSNGTAERMEREILDLIDTVFNKPEKAQEFIDNYTEWSWSLMSNKAQSKANRNLVA